MEKREVVKSFLKIAALYIIPVTVIVVLVVHVSDTFSPSDIGLWATASADAKLIFTGLIIAGILSSK